MFYVLRHKRTKLLLHGIIRSRCGEIRTTWRPVASVALARRWSSVEAAQRYIDDAHLTDVEIIALDKLYPWMVAHAK